MEEALQSHSALCVVTGPMGRELTTLLPDALPCPIPYKCLFLLYGYVYTGGIGVGSLQRRAFSFSAGLSTVVTAWVTQLGSTYVLLNMSCFVYSHLSGYICSYMSVDVCKSVGCVGVYLCVWMHLTV